MNDLGLGMGENTGAIATHDQFFIRKEEEQGAGAACQKFLRL